ncbi:hypothetical protein Mal52_13690 [Symmachiella dynata]|uniref:Uncharacterized protein n=1 Tax=Symmachiella dynata TaxID=2527995 RepID=A0A517ZK73_9PLAN|nr:hypothetical protein Mal52_13690 [Symmachiella dynata]
MWPIEMIIVQNARAAGISVEQNLEEAAAGQFIPAPALESRTDRTDLKERSTKSQMTKCAE